MQLLMMYLFHCEVHPINLPIFPCPLLFCILFWPYFHAIANLRFLNYSVWKCAVMIITLLWSFYWAEAFGNHYIYSPFFLLSSHDHYIYGPFADLFIAHPWPLQIWSFFFFLSWGIWHIWSFFLFLVNWAILGYAIMDYFRRYRLCLLMILFFLPCHVICLGLLQTRFVILLQWVLSFRTFPSVFVGKPFY